MHEQWMQEALVEAQNAAAKGEVPIGAVAVLGDAVIARAHNLRETTQDPLGHAEILLLQRLASPVTPGLTRGPVLDAGSEAGMTKRASWRLEDVSVYVTCEPCLMCMGALMHARVPRLVFGCYEPKFGACGSLYDFSKDARLNHRIEVVPGILQEDCAKLLKDFFKALRVA